MIKNYKGYKIIVEYSENGNVYTVKCIKLAQEIKPGVIEDVMVFNYVDYAAKNMDDAISEIKNKIKKL